MYEAYNNAARVANLAISAFGPLVDTRSSGPIDIENIEIVGAYAYPENHPLVGTLSSTLRCIQLLTEQFQVLERDILRYGLTS